MDKLKTLWRALKLSIRVQGIPVLIIRLLGFAAVLLPIISAKQLQALTDSIQALSAGSGSPLPSLKIMLTIAALYIVQMIFSIIESHGYIKSDMNIRRYINRTILKHKCEARYKYIDNYDDFHKRISFINEYSGYRMAGSINNIVNILQELFYFAAVAYTLWSFNPYLVLIIVATSIPGAILSYVQEDQSFREKKKWIEEGSLAVHYYNMIGAAGYSYDGLQEIRHYGLFDYLKKRWRSIADEYLKKKNRLMARHLRYNTAADFLRSAVYLVVLLLAARSIYNNPALGLGSFTLVYSLSGQLQEVCGSCFILTMTTVKGIPYLQEFFYLDSIEREPGHNGQTEALDGNIEFENVSFTYPNTDSPALKDINVTIRKGEKIAVVGENGSGKSTFINLLCGMYDPTEGSIRLGGKDVKSNLSAVRNAISVVFQDFARYEASIRDNITVSDTERKASDDEIMELLRKIKVDDIVNEQKNGLDELVGSFSEKANNLSGGQWQKISIARAAYRSKARIMILDEPTAALDPMAEAQLYRNFASLTEGKTTILISHRLGIASIVDRILVFADGRIVEDGSHKELMRKNGYYARMYNAQAQWYT